MNNRAIFSAVIVSSMFLPAVAAFSQESATPPARVRSVRVRDGGLVRVPLEIDLTTVLRDTTPVSLGAYVARATFDPKSVQFLRVEGGTGAFADVPVATSTPKANTEGLVRIAAVQTGQAPVTGHVGVAAFYFRELVPGGVSTVHVTLESAAAALIRDAAGAMPEVLAIPVEKADVPSQ